MRGVLAGDVAPAAFDAAVLIDSRLGGIVQVQILPLGDIRHRTALDRIKISMVGAVHPLLQTLDKLLDDLEPVCHGGGADLHIGCAKRDELGRVTPGGNAANTGNRQVRRFRVAGDGGHHVQRDRLHRRATIAAMRSLAIDGGLRRELVEIDRDNGTENLQKAEKIYKDLKKQNIDALLDDVDESMSNKFKKHDLIGVPYQIIIGSKSEQGKFEFKELNSQTEMLSLESIKSKLKKN